jgi:DNA repair exonuclease SbcCD nuclease subunit
MAKICVLGDTHFSVRGDSLEFHRYFSKFYENIFFPYLEENKIQTIIQLGDLFDRRKYINFNSLYLSRRYFFEKLLEKNIKLIVLLGNHCSYFRNTLEVNSPNLLLGEYKNIEIIENFTSLNLDGLDIDIVPWICDDNENDIFQKIKNTKSEVCLGHFEISGFEMDKGIVCESGIDKKLLSKYDIVLSGHFHHKSSSDNITYVGTPYEMTWSDYLDPKGFHIFDTETRELDFIKNPLTMFNKLFYNDEQQDMDFWKKVDYSLYKEKYVKMVVVNKQNPYLFDQVVDNLYKVGCSDISIVEDHLDVGELNDDLVDQAQDTLTILNSYVDVLELNVDNEKLKLIMRELYIEALNTEVAD